MSYRLVSKIPSPFSTLSGKTSGPAVSLGRHRGKPGAPLWLHLDELRSVVRAAGWPNPETVADAHAALERETARADAAEEKVAELEQENQTLRDAHAALAASALNSAAPEEPEKSPSTNAAGTADQPAEQPAAAGSADTTQP